jgi:addiction module HigA family antidote
MDDLIRRDALGRTDFSDVATGRRLPNVTPGEVLRIEFMEPLRLSARSLAADIDVPANRITEIVNGTRAITSDTAVRLGLRLGTSAEFWMNLQASHDLEEARRRNREGISRRLRSLKGSHRSKPPTEAAKATIERLEQWLAELD